MHFLGKITRELQKAWHNLIQRLLINPTARVWGLWSVDDTTPAALMRKCAPYQFGRYFAFTISAFERW